MRFDMASIALMLAVVLLPGAPTPATNDATNISRPSKVRSTAVPAALESTHKRIVVVDAGHNGANRLHSKEIDQMVDAGGFLKACNTVGTSGLSGLSEAAYNWAVATRLESILRRDGWIVVLTRSDNNGWGPCVDRRGLTAGRVGAVALLSIHADGAPATGHGFHVIYPAARSGVTATTASSSSDLAVAVRDAMVNAGFAPSTYIGRNGLNQRSDLGTLNRSSSPSMMIESGNMRNPADDAILSSGQEQLHIAQAIAAGFESWSTARR